MLQLAAVPINKEVCALTSIDPQRLVSAVRVGRHREDVGIVESTTAQMVKPTMLAWFALIKAS